jgi:hypothetical protein
MTEIMNSPDTYHPFFRIESRGARLVGQTENANIPMGWGVKKLYTSVILTLFAFA